MLSSAIEINRKCGRPDDPRWLASMSNIEDAIEADAPVLTETQKRLKLQLDQRKKSEESSPRPPLRSPHQCLARPLLTT